MDKSIGGIGIWIHFTFSIRILLSTDMWANMRRIHDPGAAGPPVYNLGPTGTTQSWITDWTLLNTTLSHN